jgi:hypothetical protein
MSKTIISNEQNENIFLLSRMYKETIFQNRLPVLYNKFYNSKNQLLFIGLNPSFSDNSIKGLKKTKEEYLNFFSHKELNEEHIKEIIEVHENSLEEYPYFNKFKSVVRSLEKENTNFAHIDLFHCRRTSQKDLIHQLENELSKDDKDFFISKSIEILENLILQISPKILIIENTATRDYLIKYSSFPEVYSINEKFGTPLLNQSVPVFYTSMLTGQRALDLGSFNRLIWHIKHCLSLLEE